MVDTRAGGSRRRAKAKANAAKAAAEQQPPTVVVSVPAATGKRKAKRGESKPPAAIKTAAQSAKDDSSPSPNKPKKKKRKRIHKRRSIDTGDTADRQRIDSIAEPCPMTETATAEETTLQSPAVNTRTRGKKRKASAVAEEATPTKDQNQQRTPQKRKVETKETPTKPVSLPPTSTRLTRATAAFVAATAVQAGTSSTPPEKKKRKKNKRTRSTVDTVAAVAEVYEPAQKKDEPPPPPSSSTKKKIVSLLKVKGTVAAKVTETQKKAAQDTPREEPHTMDHVPPVHVEEEEKQVAEQEETEEKEEEEVTKDADAGYMDEKRQLVKPVVVATMKKAEKEEARRDDAEADHIEMDMEQDEPAVAATLDVEDAMVGDAEDNVTVDDDAWSGGVHDATAERPQETDHLDAYEGTRDTPADVDEDETRDDAALREVAEEQAVGFEDHGGSPLHLEIEEENGRAPTQEEDTATAEMGTEDEIVSAGMEADEFSETDDKATEEDFVDEAEGQSSTEWMSDDDPPSQSSPMRQYSMGEEEEQEVDELQEQYGSEDYSESVDSGDDALLDQQYFAAQLLPTAPQLWRPSATNTNEVIILSSSDSDEGDEDANEDPEVDTTSLHYAGQTDEDPDEGDDQEQEQIDHDEDHDESDEDEDGDAEMMYASERVYHHAERPDVASYEAVYDGELGEEDDHAEDDEDDHAVDEEDEESGAAYDEQYIVYGEDESDEVESASQDENTAVDVSVPQFFFAQPHVGSEVGTPFQIQETEIADNVVDHDHDMDESAVDQADVQQSLVSSSQLAAGDTPIEVETLPLRTPAPATDISPPESLAVRGAALDAVAASVTEACTSPTKLAPIDAMAWSSIPPSKKLIESVLVNSPATNLASLTQTVLETPVRPLKRPRDSAWGPSFGLQETLSSQAPVGATEVSPLSSWFFSNGPANFKKRVMIPRPRDHMSSSVSSPRHSVLTPRPSKRARVETETRTEQVTTDSDQRVSRVERFVQGLLEKSSWRSWYSSCDPTQLLDPPLPTAMLRRIGGDAAVSMFSATSQSAEPALPRDETEYGAPVGKKNALAALEDSIREEKKRARVFDRELLQLLHGKTLSGKELMEEFSHLLPPVTK